MDTLRDHLWLWCHSAGSHNLEWGLPAPSSITPAQAAEYMGIPNAIMVVYGGKPEPPFDGPASEMASLDRVVWSIVGDSSSTRNDEQTDLEEVVRLAGRFPNIAGAMMDDLFHDPDDKGSISRFSPEDIAGFQQRLRSQASPLELWTVAYQHDLQRPVRPYFDHVDAVTYWTWHARDIHNIVEKYPLLEEIIPDRKRLLGCYMWDYGTHAPMPVDMMRFQCETGLKWLEEGRIQGMIFLASCVCDLDLEAVQWTREWIAANG